MTDSAIPEDDAAQSAAVERASSERVIVECDVPAQMRDGVVLRATVYRPAGHGPWPTLLTRTPYGKDDPLENSWCGLDPVQAARAGFMVVVQDARGRFASDGDWEPHWYEGQDGYDSVEWAAHLPGSSGRVGMFGGSYCGNTQWLAALEQPPSLAAISPALTWSDPMDGWFARGGAVELGVAVRWTLETSIDNLHRRGLSDAELQRGVAAVLDDCDQLPGHGYWDLPVNNMAVLARHDSPDNGAIRALESPGIAAWCRIAGSHDRVQAPSLHTGGWYDIFLQGTLDNYRATASLDHESRLIVGPWTHLTFADPIGERTFGIRAGRNGVPAHTPGDWNDLQLAWFRRHLAPDSDLQLSEMPVRIFVMGRNQWRDEPSWPPVRAVHERWLLGSDGSLSLARTDSDDRPSQFIYDPTNPVPTVGGNGVLTPDNPAGPRDQAKIEGRDDVLVFTSEPLQHDLEVTGRVRVVLHAESSVTSTDWVARLCDVHPNGQSINLCDGILRVPEAADKCRRYEIDLWSTSNVFLPGHRLRVHVTSSSFPRWDRNLNTGNQRESRTEPAHQRIYHDPERPSYIELPVIAQ